MQPGVSEKGDWGIDVVGLVKVVQNGKQENEGGAGSGEVIVNTLSAGLVRRKSSTPGNNGVNALNPGLIRRKSKAVGEEEKLPGVTEEQKQNGVAILPASLLRKKPKPQEEVKETPVVNVLPTNLVRKKPKAGE